LFFWLIAYAVEQRAAQVRELILTVNLKMEKVPLIYPTAAMMTGGACPSLAQLLKW
jgi:hypothetical protein